MAIFKELKFKVNQNIFFHNFKNPDKGFGYVARIDKNELTELQIETFEYLRKCRKKNLLGAINMVFELEGVGEITKLERRVEKLEYKNQKYIISNTY